MNKTLVIIGIFALLGCSAMLVGKSYNSSNDATMQQSAAINSPQPLAFANKYGNYLAGRTASINGDHLNAAKFLGHIAQLEKKKSPPMLGNLAIRHYLLSGEIEKAIKLADFYDDKAKSNISTAKAKNIIPDDGYNNLLLVVSALKDKQTPENEIVENEIVENADLKKQDFAIAELRLKNINPQGFASLFVPFIQSWIAFEQTNKITRVTVADALPHQQLRSLQYYHEALQLEINAEIAKAAAIYEKHTINIEKTPDAMIFSALRFFNANNLSAKSLELLEELRSKRPRDAFWHMRTTEEMLKEIANCDYLKISNTTQGVAESLANIGYILASEGAAEEGQILLQLAIYLRPNHDLYKLILAESLEELDYFDAALNLYQQIKQPPFVADLVQISIARTLHSQGKTEQAKELLQQLAKTLPVKYNIEVMLGDLERAANNDAQAIAHYSKALEIIGKPSKIDWPLLFRRGILLDQLGELEKAQTDFTTALSLSPSEPEIVNYMAYSWLMRGEKLEQAREMLEGAVDSAPNNAHIIDSYGFALYLLGDYKKAFNVLEAALELIPADPTVNDHYANVLWQLGRKNEAIFHWKRALLFKPNEKGAKSAIKLKLKNGLKPLVK